MHQMVIDEYVTRATRKASYEKVKSVTGDRCQSILEVLGDKEMTAHEITEVLMRKGVIPYYDRNYVSPRLTELRAAGVVETAGKRLCKRTDRKVAVWRVV